MDTLNSFVLSWSICGIISFFVTIYFNPHHQENKELEKKRVVRTYSLGSIILWAISSIILWPWFVKRHFSKDFINDKRRAVEDETSHRRTHIGLKQLECGRILDLDGKQHPNISPRIGDEIKDLLTGEAGYIHEIIPFVTFGKHPSIIVEIKGNEEIETYFSGIRTLWDIQLAQK